MSNRFVNPYPQFLNSTPAVYSGGFLYFYQTGTSTPLDTFSVEALTAGFENSNPITLNSAGRPAVDIFLKDQDYKVVLKDSSGNTIWTADPVRARDASFIARTKNGSGSPNGSVAGTAGSASVLADFYWDYTNSILYVCTTTGTTTTAVWTAVNASTAAAVVVPPQGYLTLTSATPVITADVTAATAVYYTPYVGNLVPIYNGASFTPTTFAELTLTLSSSHAASNIYDVFVFSNSGVITIATGPSWSAGTSGSITAGSCARGTGAGGTALSRVSGLYTNAVQITGRNGATTYTIGANLATYVGSIFMDGTNGQLTCHRAFGQSRKWGVWNAYNKNKVVLAAGDGTASWNYNSATFRAANGASANSITLFTGLAEPQARIIAHQRAALVSGSAATAYGMKSGIGWNSTSSASGFTGLSSIAVASSAIDLGMNAASAYDPAPFLGINVATMLEACTAASTLSFTGTEAGARLTADYMA